MSFVKKISLSYKAFVDQFWYKYSHMEEMLGELDKARAVFEDWLTWEPPLNAWDAYLKFEERHGNDRDRCRHILTRLIESHSVPSSYLRAAKYEEKIKDFRAARRLFERALAELGKDAFATDELIIAFCRFEIRQRNFKATKTLFAYALEKLPSDASKRVSNMFLDFQKQYGSAEELEALVLQRRRQKLEQTVVQQPHSYDHWFDLISLQEQAPEASANSVRELYE